MLISFAVTAKLICVFVFAYAKSRFSHDAADFSQQQLKQNFWQQAFQQGQRFARGFNLQRISDEGIKCNFHRGPGSNDVLSDLLEHCLHIYQASFPFEAHKYVDINIIYPYNLYPLTPLFYRVNLGFTRVYIFSLFLL